MKKIVAITAVLMSAVFALGGCGKKDDADTPADNLATYEPAEKTDNAKIEELTENSIDAEIRLTDGDVIKIELYPDVAPKTVANFIKNVQEGFYTGTIFHRVIDGFVIQGGGYDEEYKRKDVSETVEGEFADNGIDNPLSHERGVISMARTSEPNSASTQFFIVQTDSDYLDGQYAAFGRVTEGMEVVDKIAQAEKMEDPPSGMSDLPKDKFVIESITINTETEADSTATENEKE